MADSRVSPALSFSATVREGPRRVVGYLKVSVGTERQRENGSHVSQRLPPTTCTSPCERVPLTLCVGALSRSPSECRDLRVFVVGGRRGSPSVLLLTPVAMVLTWSKSQCVWFRVWELEGEGKYENKEQVILSRVRTLGS